VQSALNIESAVSYVECLKEVGAQLHLVSEILYEFGPNRPYIGDDSNGEFRGWLGGSPIASKSGVYIFSDDEGQIFYIGKATKDNLHQRVCAHLGAPVRLPSGWMTFPKIQFDVNKDETARKILIDGKARLHVFTVSERTEASILEVYLQIMHIKTKGCLPCFNMQIG
jgi:hypothetical protein